MYEDKTPEAIKAEILAAIRQSQGLSAMAGGFADGVAGPVAEQLSEAYRALEGVPSMLFVDESSGGYIDLVGGQYYNITRREGTRAYCDISFSGTPGLVIPKGTAFLTAGGLSYALMAAVALGPEGTGRGRLEAAEAGSAYNVEAGAIDRMYVNLTGLTDYHSEAAAGGTDAESDAALLARVRERVQRPPTSGNGYQYRQWAMEVAGVGSAKVVELPGGPGTVGVTLVDSNDRAPSEEIVEAVTAHIEEERPIGAAVTVTAAGEREVTVAAQVSLTGGAGAGAVQDAFRAALAGYLHTLIEGKYGAVYYKPADDQPYTLLYNRVLALLLNVEGVENFASLTVNGGTADVSELERVLGEQAGALRVSESDTLAQLWVDTATWGLDLWEQWVGLPSDRTRPYSYRRSRIKAKLRGQGATTAEMLRSVVASFGFEPSQISVIEHPAEYQFEIVLSDLAAVPSDVSGIESAVNEIKPAHLDYWFTYELAQLLAALRVGGGLWSIQAVTLPPMEEE